MSRGSEISQAAYDKHMFLLKERYENVVLINLLSSRESEVTLNQLFNSHHQASQIGSEFPFINFDYHALCSRGHRENLEKLYSYDLEKYCERFGFFHADKGRMLQLQQGVLRVNCLDCLDRTNSMQRFIGLKMLQRIVQSIERIDTEKVLLRLQDVYDNLWVQNGDQISKIYTGTGALEGKSILKDGTLSVARTIQNNLLDGTKQESIDILILGRTLSRDYSYRAASLLPHYFLYASPSILVNMCDRYLEYCTQEKLRLAVATWNVNGGRHFDNTVYNRARPLSDWLVDYKTSYEFGPGEGDLLNQSEEPAEPIDIYVIGFQEIVDLNAQNIVASSTQNQRDWLVEIQKTISKNDHYLLVTSVQLVGVCLFVFIRQSIAPFIRDVCNDMVKTGLGGATGNKGGVAVRLRYKATSLCFVCAHFAAGQHQVKERNDDYTEITRRIQFPMGRSINSHDYVFWCGDFNYRLEKISNDEVRRAAASGNYELLLNHDQLKLAQEANQTFKGYTEGKINFAPTYKYDMYSNDYDTSEKCRVPAYTDRILFKKRHETHVGENDLNNPEQIVFYNRIELLSSDHRPVVAEFEIEVNDIDKEARNDVLDSVLDECGPPDSTVFVSVDGHMDAGDNQVLANILKVLADGAGEIVLVRHVHSSLMVIFSDGKAAVKALELNGVPIDEHHPDNKLIVNLRTTNWNAIMREELMNNKDNTVNLVSGNGPSVHLEDDEDEAGQELNMSIGPEINPESVCIGHELFLPPDQQARLTPTETTTMPPKSPVPPPVPPKSPLNPPSRPPPPPPSSTSTSSARASPLTPSAGQDRQASGHPPGQGATGFGQLASLGAGRHDSDPFGFPSPMVAPAAADDGDQSSGLMDYSSEFDDSAFAGGPDSSMNFFDLSAGFDPDQGPSLPPPTMPPPELPPMTPSKLPPPVPRIPPSVASDGASNSCGNNNTSKSHLVKPSRAAPPPPIPSRQNPLNGQTTNEEETPSENTRDTPSPEITSAQI